MNLRAYASGASYGTAEGLGAVEASADEASEAREESLGCPPSVTVGTETQSQNYYIYAQ